MRMYDLILKKRNGQALSEDEIKYMIEGYTKGSIPDYQMSAMMMAIYFQGMDKKETLTLTNAMKDSGDVLDLSGISGIKVDKHSTGGVGDKTSLALTPIVASLGGKVAKMSGRGLGHTGGTIDKLESFPGFHTDIPIELFEKNVQDIGLSIMGQTKELAPADKKLYALRDVTATVDQIPLIASSIMSKKLASGADAMVLDVKTGSGAFMKKEEDALKLAMEMQEIGKGAGKNTIAVISDMDQPLGNAVGNILEVKEAIDTLRGKGPKDFTKLVYTLATYMLILGGQAKDKETALALIQETIDSQKALDTFAAFISSQGGDASYVYHPEKFEEATIIQEIYSDQEGYVSHIACDEVGIACMMLGGGRETKESVIDLKVGFVLHKKKGSFVSKGESIATIYADDAKKCNLASEKLLRAYSFSKDKPKEEKLIKNILL